MKKAHLIFIAASILAGIMINTGCDLTNSYDVRGTWTFTGEYDGIDFNKTITFRGDKIQGTVTDEINGTAAYTSNGYNVNFNLSMMCSLN